MAIPLLNTSPKYELVIPSTKEKIKFRPFLVKEQKVLLLAYESQDKKNIINGILDTIKACVEEVSLNKLTTYDVDYIFTQIRGKSVGEKVDLLIKCTECGFDNPVEINLDNITLPDAESSTTVKITDTINVNLRYPNYDTIMSNDKFLEATTQSEAIMEIVYSVIESIESNDELIIVKDEPKEEIERFVESMTSEQFDPITQFVQKIPVISYISEFRCNKCGHQNKRVLEGLEDFF